MKLYLNEKPRTFIITSSHGALIIRHPFPRYDKDSQTNHSHPSGSSHHHYLPHIKKPNDAKQRSSPLNAKAIVEFVKLELVDLSHFRLMDGDKDLLGLLGIFNIKGNIYMGFITKGEKVATPIVGEDIMKIKDTKFYCLNSDEFDHLYSNNSNYSYDTEDEVYSNENPTGHSGSKHRSSESLAGSVRRFLCNGDFFYSNDFDITSNLQERGFKNPNLNNASKFELFADSPYFKRFMWNYFLNSQIIQFRNRLTPFEASLFDQSGFLITITRGYAKTVNASISRHNDALLTLINKESCIKNGPLFGDWGADDKGAVSNFQESEIIVYTKNFCFSYVIIKGNVPIFWEVENHFSKSKFINKSSGKKIVFPGSFEASHHAFTSHIDRMVGQFGDIHIINSLPSDASNYKSSLNENLIKHIQTFNDNINDESNVTDSEIAESNKETYKNILNYTLDYTDIPLKTAAMKKFGYSETNPYNLIQSVVDRLIDFGALFYDFGQNHFIGKQLGVFRIITFNSLSKANFLSKLVCQEVIELAFRDIGINVNDDLLHKHARLWEECDEFINNNITNFISYSTKLQGSSATSTKKNFKSKVSKKYLNSVIDPKTNETSLLKLLGRLQDQVTVSLHNPIHDYISKELSKKSKLYISLKEINLFASTFNVNGSCYEGEIRNWIFPEVQHGEHDQNYDLVFIGIQEIIELSASKMVNVDSENKKFWENKIKDTLNKYNPESHNYVSLWSGQLGGLSLLLFIKQLEINKISDVESAFRKTGFGGVSSNKGAIAVRLSYESTELCFITSHLAAGLTNVDERHNDYKVIVKGLKFSKNRRIRDHDGVIWLGDLNYRINLNNEQTKLLIEQQNFTKLFEYDQLNKQMANGESFPFFDEMEIKFPPTYKFDNGTKNYDTSEKQRIPAWTDRILNLSRDRIIRQLTYNTYEDLIFSDHRPVYSVFKIKINIENESIKKSLSNEIYQMYQKKFGEINDLFINNNNISYLINDLDNKVLPPPSSDAEKWWLNGGLPAKIVIPELKHDQTFINPNYPKNPFEITDHSEFINKS